MTGEIRVFSRRGCHLCEQLLEDLEPLVRGRARIVVCDIDERDDWRAAYNERVPVVEWRGAVLCEYFLDREAVLRAVATDAG